MDVDALKARLPASIAEQVKSILVKADAATVVVDATGMAPAAREGLEAAIKDVIGAAEGIETVRVAMMADKKRIRIIAVGSGKGGVGKSTLSANLAVALARMGRKVGMVDADIYGPSQPKILANEGQRPEAHDDKMVPVPSKYGVPVLSMGHLVPNGQAIAWRGPMAGNALGQLIDAHWEEVGVDTLLIDLPPGTGDVQLTMLSKHKPDGAIIVSTPQDLALIDAQRAAQMFDSGKVPLIGLVENMAGYSCPHCGEVSDPFGRGGVEAVSKETDIPFLGRIPLAPEIRSASDEGVPPASGDGVHGQAFAEIAQKLAAWLDNPAGAEAE